MTDWEIYNKKLAEERYQNFKRAKIDIYKMSINLFQMGYPVKNIIKRVYSEFRKVDNALTKEVITDYVWKSVNDFLKKEQQEVVKDGENNGL